MVLPDAVLLDHLLQSFVEALRPQPVTPLTLQFLLSLEETATVADKNRKTTKLCMNQAQTTSICVAAVHVY